MYLPGKRDPRSTLLSAAFLVAAILIAVAPAEGVRWPWNKNAPWPSSSEQPVVPLGHPPVESDPIGAGYRFVAYGDQRALADGEWQEMISRIVELEQAEGKIAFVLDSGDIVANGRHADQFRFLSDLLEPIDHIPYLLGVGNHEVDNNRSREAREHAAAFFSYLDPDFSPDRMYYRKDLGAATFLCLDTNDLVYGEHADRKRCPPTVDPESREGLQMKWLDEQLASLDDDPARPTIVAMHHPPVQTSGKHRETSASTWNVTHDGRRLIDVLADGGVDVIVTGHTHTYERFRLTRDDGREIDVVNISGRPRDGVLWVGSGSRRARDIRGREDEWLEEKGWTGLDRWDVSQEEVMLESDEANQFAVFDLESDGSLFLQAFFLDDEAPGGLRRGERVRIH
jgi:hypothetical protein